MKATGIVSTIDEVGRLVLPKKIRNQLDLKQVEIFIDGDSVVLKKYNPSCIFCGSADATVEYHGKKVCSECIEKLEKISDIAGEN